MLAGAGWWLPAVAAHATAVTPVTVVVAAAFADRCDGGVDVTVVNLTGTHAYKVNGLPAFQLGPGTTKPAGGGPALTATPKGGGKVTVKVYADLADAAADADPLPVQQVEPGDHSKHVGAPTDKIVHMYARPVRCGGTTGIEGLPGGQPSASAGVPVPSASASWPQAGPSGSPGAPGPSFSQPGCGKSGCGLGVQAALPTTGGRASTVAVAGAVALAAGFGLYWAARRRRTRFES